MTTRERWKTLVTDWAKIPMGEDYELYLELPNPYQAGKSVVVVSVNTKTGERVSSRVRLRSSGRDLRKLRMASNG